MRPHRFLCSLPASLSAQQSALHTCPVVQATSADLDIREDSGCLPVAQSPAADWQFGQQLPFVHESPLATCVFRQIVLAPIQARPAGNNCRFDFCATSQLSLPRRTRYFFSAGRLFNGEPGRGLPRQRQTLMLISKFEHTSLYALPIILPKVSCLKGHSPGSISGCYDERHEGNRFV